MGFCVVERSGFDMKRYISPSLMCVDLMNVERDVKLLEEVGVDYLHIDIMDNHFVPNITLSTDFINGLRKITKLPLDIHLMMENPEQSFDRFSGCTKEDIISIHYEATVHIQRALGMLKDMGVKAGLALNPGTPLTVLEDLLSDLDVIVIMTVNPGFAGQKLIPATLDKIKRLRNMLDEKGYSHILIEVDGNVSFENAAKMHQAGANIYIAGSSSVFNADGNLSDNTNKMRKIITS